VRESFRIRDFNVVQSNIQKPSRSSDSFPCERCENVLVDGFEGAHETEIVLQFDGDDLLRERFEDTVKG
jgi:hypothetical protein